MAFLVLSLYGPGPAWAAAELPVLTGRVVDDADLLTAQDRETLTAKLKQLEDRSGIQLVVATIPSLGGEEIEPFANRLFRSWKLGEAKRNDGVLILVAPNEHRARIEVGYGLEGTLTDALSKLIITNAMIPRFKAADYPGGIVRGTDDVISVLSTDAADWQQRPDLQPQRNAAAGGQASGDDFSPFLVVLVVGFLILVIVLRHRRGGGFAGPVFIPSSRSGWDGGSGSGGGSGDSGFSGGGGSSGGGGASGDW